MIMWFSVLHSPAFFQVLCEFFAMKTTHNSKMRRTLRAFTRPAYFLIVLAFSFFIFSELFMMIKETRNRVTVTMDSIWNRSFAEIEKTAELLQFLNKSAPSLGRALSTSLNGTQLSFIQIETKVAPALFLALSTIQQAAQVSYIGLDGLFFSFYNDISNPLVAVYSNTTSFSSKWYTQPVTRELGALYGDAVAFDPLLPRNSSWLQEAVNSSSGYSSLGKAWTNPQVSLFLSTVAMDGRGVVSLGYPIEVIIDHFAALDFHGGDFHLASMYGQVIMQTKLPYTQIQVYNDTALVQRLKANGDPISSYNLSCNVDGGKLRTFNKEISGIKYSCSTLDIAGLKSVFVLAYAGDGLVNLVHRNSALSLTLITLVFVFIVISLCIYIFFTARATSREMFLCAALIKQTEATQQAERKSMNKTKAYAGANHDVRNSLSAVRASIHFCREEANPDSKLAGQLVRMENHTDDLLRILNSILDMSKIEAGKTSLEMEDFNLVQLLEDVVDIFYPLGKNRGIDIVLDPCDGSVLKSPNVRGDRIKLKQILCNLLNNALKFTSEGHVAVRAVVKKNNFKQEIIASNRTTASKFLSQFCYKNKDSFNDLDALHTVEENPDEMEFDFEVDDTGKGIPKDKQKSIFEDYVQVKETAMGQEGCGLGLGIVQSLVRVMKGELRIVEKEAGERGTCFKFNVFLSTSQPASVEPEEDRRSSGFHQHFPFMSPKPEGSHIMLLMPGDERRRVLKKYIESLNIKVTAIKQARLFHLELDKIMRKLSPLPHSNPGNTEVYLSDYLSNSASTSTGPGVSDVTLRIKDGNEQFSPHERKMNPKSSSGILLLVVDVEEASHCSTFQSTLATFRREIPKSLYKVAWLDDQITSHSRDEEKDRLNPEGDFLIHKPLHGSRLMQVLSLLPERKGASRRHFPKVITRTTETIQEIHQSADSDIVDLISSEIESDVPPYFRSSPQQVVIQKRNRKGNDLACLNGKKIMVVDDVELLRRLTASHLQKLGASVECWGNGKDALNQVCKAFSDQKMVGDSMPLPYDYIFMDCEMPVMNGYEATRLIRKEEEQYGVRTPIIALTAHAMPEEASKIMDAGMDFHLTKPLQVDKMLEVIRSINNQSVNKDTK